MLTKIKDFRDTLNEEIKYHENILLHKKGLEATLWGLQEQAQFPENSAKQDQTELTEEINRCQLKIINCNKVIKSHNSKLKAIFSSFKNTAIASYFVSFGSGDSSVD